MLVIDPTRKIIALNVINRPTCAIAKLSTIIKIRKYKRFQKGHHFILMAMKMHDTFGCDMDCFIRECACLFHDKQSENHLSISFCILFFKQHVSIAFNML